MTAQVRIPYSSKIDVPLPISALSRVRRMSATALGIAMAWMMLVVFSPITANAAEKNSYKVEISGAGNLTSLLHDHLDIQRHQSDDDTRPEEIQRMTAAAPRQMRELLATEGYFSPVITQELLHDSENHWTARYSVELGPLTRVSEVDLQFSGALASGSHADPRRIAALRRRWQFTAGEPFTQNAWGEAKSTLLKGLLNRDFPAAKISSSEARVNPQQHTAALSVAVDSGPFFTFGALQINGLKHYSQEKINLLNPITSGEPYSQDKLTELQTRLQDSGYFRSAFATIEVDPEHPEQVPVRVDLVENPRRRLAFGVGYSTDSGARGQVKWLDRQFLGHDWRLESELRVDRLTKIVGGDLYFPQRDDGWSPSVGGHFAREDITGEINDRFRTDARITGSDKNNEEVWGVSYLTEQQRVADETTHHRQALIASYGYTWRRVDNLMAPRRGYVAAVEVAAGPRGLVNQSNIGRVVAHANWLSPTRHRFQLLVRGQVGQVVGAGREDIPSELLFRTGGDQTVRGYAFNSLGVEESGAIVGGRVMALASAEVIYHLTDKWGVALFHDAGNAADTFKNFQFKHGSGIGARWHSPIGTVNMDLAYGHAVKQVRLHFSIGYGF